ncbi:hypothetical protein ROLI_039680 [Roseobacter fucihabitans]|uniref:Uncharacterized protein n=1 Tax=Roseobacter fucihabitans TaxID=1537242 RepID=A0ABZ2BY07_9RHOB|nr:hypothetical protein [Roseobacter litoralis]MBC6964929.1 hypothetical protein [Roseobacter litoralis]
MTKSGITINQSGGNAVFGNVSQGNKNKNVATSSMTVTETAFREFFEEIETLRAKAAVSDQEAAELSEKVAVLEKELGEKGPGALISMAAKQLYENYGWAAKPLGRLFGLVGL